MIMPGLGGMKHYNAHVDETARVINQLEPEFVTFIGLRVDPNTPYEKKFIEDEALRENRRLTPREIAFQTIDMIKSIERETTIGIHGDDVHTFGHNPLSVGAKKLTVKYPYLAYSSLTKDSLDFIRELEERAKRIG